MKRVLRSFALLLLTGSILHGPVLGQADNRQHLSEVKAWLEPRMDDIVKTYVAFHTTPEVSFHEEKTSERFAQYLKDSGYQVTTKVGGFGVVGILENGDGPTLMLRTDLDALPVTETTPLPFASKATFVQDDGSVTGVMHACGHDVHMTNMVTVAKFMSESRDRWKGRLIVIGQPAEERGSGARAMLKDGLFSKFPKPDFAVALHVGAEFEAGKIKVIAGPAFANVDSVDIVVKGKGGHGSAPHTTIDPVVQAAELVVSLQTIVSREVKPSDPAVVTVGAIHGGTKHNIIGNDCRLQLTVRSYSDPVREKVLAAIKRKANAIAQAYDAPAPEITVSEGTPSLKNNQDLTARLKPIFQNTIGAENVLVDEPSMGGEDFSQYGLAGVPILMYRVGTLHPERFAKFQQLNAVPPSLHSSDYYPDLENTIPVTVATMTAAALDILKK